MELKQYSEIWGIDFEFSARDGERPVIRCIVAVELSTGRTIRLWVDELTEHPPFNVGPNSLIVAYFASAEMHCFRVLGWPIPENIIDLFVEFKNKYNGSRTTAGLSLNGALIQHGLDPIVEKEEMRNLAMREGNDYTDDEKQALLAYCHNDVTALVKLLPLMIPHISLPHALVRGQYMNAVGTMEYNGVPMDTKILDRLTQSGPDLTQNLIEKIDKDYGVFEGTTFKENKFEYYLAENDISWPRLPSGKLDLKGDTFRDMSKSHPKINSLKELRHLLSGMKLNKLTVGSDGRNRCLLSPFSSKTSRNQPSNTKFIFGPSTWIRGLIKPPQDHGVAYIDYSQQEFAIAAVLSDDTNMQEAYSAGDPYLEFARMAGLVPSGATKQSHPQERNLCKACVLGVQYGIGVKSLAHRIAGPPAKARELLQMHKETFPKFWKWSDEVINHAAVVGRLHSTLGWSLNLTGEINPRSAANWPVQTNGAEIIRLAAIFAIEEGIKVCCPIHDALLIEAPIERLEQDISRTQQLMQRAGGIVLRGFKLRTDVDRVVYPNRYMDERGIKMWNTIMELIGCKSEMV